MNRRKTAAFCGIIVICVLASVALFQLSVMAKEDMIAVTGFMSEKLEGGAPSGWDLKTSKGTPDLAVEKTECCGYVLHLKSDSSSSYGIAKDLNLSKGEYPFLNWKWRVDTLPVGGDVRKADKDDQAIQIYVAFKETGWPAKVNTPLVGYVWDNECPKGTTVTSPQPLAGKVRYIVIRDKTDKLGEWYTEKRNVFEDYKALFPDIDGGAPRDIKAVSVYINSQHTKSRAESWLADVYFSGN
ncbi:MAG: DUF3047 domain-containing protein [Deltaproteobacteria bacterium]|nr:DUF3047 domain-containing protein [Deltaproteobacteria bacterium]MBN2687104.1 DUF3047 domain-containing protein [Deltaproteobacteria bacterium]